MLVYLVLLFSHFLDTFFFPPPPLSLQSLLINLNIIQFHLSLHLILPLLLSRLPPSSSSSSSLYFLMWIFLICEVSCSFLPFFPLLPPPPSIPCSCILAYRISVLVLREQNRVRPFPWVDQTKSLAPFTSVWLHRNRNRGIHQRVCCCWAAKR